MPASSEPLPADLAILAPPPDDVIESLGGRSQGSSGGPGSGKGPGPCQGLDDELDGHELLDEPPLEDEELSELLDDEDPVELLDELPPEEELECEPDEDELSELLEDELLVE
ncbi:hypothetical protein [Allorhodopirellula heiligendammensis]|uniref:Uncharacterized protein n=1 Tax=Allorhodopirellula heiligendammensis TaxID=2714739 RepID=A0A5C6C548_9BACT|nr:hypothetical protein [Allorhodopirellula heiligendammensis]TWU18576.1 hypothetical protein Poly21_07400 [Allorhodopirellula heiligendammensis]